MRKLSHRVPKVTQWARQDSTQARWPWSPCPSPHTVSCFMFIPSLSSGLLYAAQYSRHCGFYIRGFPNSFCQHFCNQNTTKTVLIQRKSTAVGLDGGRSAVAAVIGNGWTAWEEKDPGVPSRMLPPGASAGSRVTSRDLELGKGTRGGGGLAWGHEARWLAGQV